MPENEVGHSRREQQLIPEDVITRQEYDDWLRTLPRMSSEVIAPKMTVKKATIQDHPDKARA